jgi:hypothetical protein
MDSTDWMALKPDHTVVWSSFSVADYKIEWEGVWYAGGSYIYMVGEAKPPGIWEIIDVGPDKLRLRIAKQEHIFKRVSDVPPDASNQTMERTATRRAFTSGTTRTTQLPAIFALGGRRSSRSR